jgi:hyperosmotically inducible periplasmic protein
MPKEIAMHDMSFLRKSMIAGSILMVFAAAPFSLMAQATNPSQSMPEQTQQPSSTDQSQSTSTTPSSNETVPGKTNDAWITTKVKSKLAAAKGVKASDISVSTTDGAVTLTGTATSTKEKTRAEHLAKQVKGVKSVDATGLTVNASNSDSTSGGSTPPSGG